MIKTIKIIENYISDKLEEEILSLIPNKPASGINRNQVIRYGSREPYNSHIKSETIPPIFKQFTEFEFDSVTINEYFENQNIPYHIDKIGGGPDIVILNLLGGATIEFKKSQGRDSRIRRPTDDYVSFYMPRKSLVIISDELRYDWSHSVTATEKRYSIVFRNSKYVREGT